MDYPIFRKYPNDKSFFKITSKEGFEELKLTGSLVELHRFKANIHPDRVFIQDMIAMRDGHWKESNPEEFQAMEKRLRA